MYKKTFGYRVIHQNSLTSCPGPKKKEQVVKETSFKFIGKKNYEIYCYFNHSIYKNSSNY